MPGVGELPSRPALPDVLTFENGDRVTTAAQWTKRREEMKRILAYYATGLMPPAPGNVRGRDLKSAAVLGGSGELPPRAPVVRAGLEVRVRRRPLRAHSAKGRVPAVVFPTFGPTPGGTPLATMVRPPEQGKGLDALVDSAGRSDRARRGGRRCHATEASRCAARRVRRRIPRPPPRRTPNCSGADTRSPSITTRTRAKTRSGAIPTEAGRSARRATIPPIPDYDWGLAAGWAWGISRCIDYLETQPFADRGKFIAVGHSRIGKAVLIAGAFDERIAVVAPAGQRRRRDRGLPLQRRARRRPRGPRRHDAEERVNLAVGRSDPMSRECSRSSSCDPTARRAYARR